MGFDDRQTGLLALTGCLAVLGGLGAPLIDRLFGIWWMLLVILPTVGLIVLVQLIHRKRD